MATRRTPKIGSLFAQRYRVESELGRGAVGVVFGVRDEKTGVACALKLLNRPEGRVEGSRVIREGRALMLISSPHVVRVFDVDERPGYGPYLVLERLVGAPLSEHAPLGVPLPEELVIRIALQLCEALVQAHAVGVIHRDIKLSNLFLSRDVAGVEVLKVLDFGIAKVAMPDAGAPSTLTKEELLGSPQYMSPEQLVRPRDVDARTDLWSVGVLLFRLLTGRFPFDGESIGEISSAVLKGPIPTLAAGGARPSPRLPRLQAIVDRCLARDPAARWPSAAELAASLRSVDAPLAPTSPAPTASSPRGRRIAVVAAVIGLLGLLAAAAAIVATR